MRAVAVAVLVLSIAVAALAASAPLVCDRAMINEINRDAASSWTAACHPRFHGKTIDEAKRSLMHPVFLNRPARDTPIKSINKPMAVPSSFDSRTQWPGCVHPIMDQAQCGSCWAFGATESLSDRFCIQGHVNVTLSPQSLVSCDTTNMGCNGGMLDTAWAFMKSTGVASIQCLPYESGDGNVPQCPTTCKDGSPIKLYQAKSYYKVSPTILFWERVADIQKEVMTNGPVEVAFSVYQDFMSYKSGVYQHKSGGLLGGHAVKLVGWGEENGTPYWLIANSWGPDWGEDGFFKILRGKNECGIEDDVYAGMAAL